MSLIDQESSVSVVIRFYGYEEEARERLTQLLDIALSMSIDCIGLWTADGEGTPMPVLGLYSNPYQWSFEAEPQLLLEFLKKITDLE